jgi:S-methylmethionine-dependent homocysteine/selenocysteine methylase
MDDQLEALQTKAVDLALEARRNFEEERGPGGRNIRVAGCLSPVASYMPKVAQTQSNLIAQYKRVAEVQADRVDLFLCETMGSVFEATSAVQAAKSFGKPVWCALSIQDDDSATLRSGESLAQALESIRASCSPDAFLLNCSKPEAIDAAMPVLKRACSSNHVPYGAYPNAFKSVEALKGDSLAERTVDKIEKRTDLGGESFADVCTRWVGEHGASLVGGCCEIEPFMIEKLFQRLNTHPEYELV